MPSLKLRDEQLDHSGPLADAPWRALVADRDGRHAEAGVQRLGDDTDVDTLDALPADERWSWATGGTLWGVWGWNPETRQTFLNSTHHTEREALQVARSFVVHRVGGHAEPEVADLDQLCQDCQHATALDRVAKVDLQSDEVLRQVDAERELDSPGVEVTTDDGVVLVADQDVADQVDAGYSVGEAEDIVDHDEGKHGEESVPGCPRCQALYDPEDEDEQLEADAQEQLVGSTLGDAGLALDSWTQMLLSDHRSGDHRPGSEPDCPICQEVTS